MISLSLSYWPDESFIFPNIFYVNLQSRICRSNGRGVDLTSLAFWYAFVGITNWNLFGVRWQRFRLINGRVTFHLMMYRKGCCFLWPIGLFYLDHSVPGRTISQAFISKGKILAPFHSFGHTRYNIRAMTMVRVSIHASCIDLHFDTKIIIIAHMLPEISPSDRKKTLKTL